jgi:transposase-like protein
MNKLTRFAPEVRERAVRLLLEHEKEYPTRWSAIKSLAEKIGCSPETLRHWARQAEGDGGPAPGPARDDAERLRALERENKELRRANEILKKAAAYFAQAELDRRGT